MSAPVSLHIGTVALQGLPRAHAAAVERGLAAEIGAVLTERRWTGNVAARPRITATLPASWHTLSPERLVRSLAERIAEELTR